MGSKLKQLMSRFEQVRELLPLGAYVPGADPLTDRAVTLFPRVEAFLHCVKEDQRAPGTADAILRPAEPIRCSPTTIW